MEPDTDASQLGQPLSATLGDNFRKEHTLTSRRSRYPMHTMDVAISNKYQLAC